MIKENTPKNTPITETQDNKDKKPLDLYPKAYRFAINQIKLL